MLPMSQSATVSFIIYFLQLSLFSRGTEDCRGGMYAYCKGLADSETITSRAFTRKTHAILDFRSELK